MIQGFRREGPPQGPPATAPAAPGPSSTPAPAKPSDEPSPFSRLVAGLGREVEHGERTVSRALGGAGKDLGPADLIALQAGVYRYSEAVDLAAKLVDRAQSGVKTILQGQ